MRSSVSSRPTESRIMFSVIPVCRFSSAVMSEWVMEEGCWMRLSMPPRLTAILMWRMASSTRNASVSPPRTQKVTMLPVPVHCRRHSSICRSPMFGLPG